MMSGTMLRESSVGGDRRRRRASRALRQAGRALAAAQRTSAAVTSRASPGRALQEIVSGALRALGGGAAGIFVISADRKHLQAKAAAGEQAAEALGLLLRWYKTGKAWRALVAQGGLAIGDAERHPYLAHYRPVVRQRGIKSIAAAPLVARGQVIGMIVVSHQHRKRAFSRRDLPPLRLFADQAALALDSSRLSAHMRSQAAFNKQLLDDVRDPVLLLDARGRITYGNQALFEVLGRQPTQVIGRPWQELVDPADVERISAGRPQPHARGVTQREIHVVRPDGTRTPVLMTVRHGRDAQRRLVESVVGQLDRGRVEQTLRHREAMLDTIGGLARAAGRSADAPRLGARVLRSGLKLLGLSAGSIHFIEQGRFVLVASCGMIAEEVELIERLPVSGSVSERVVDSGKPLVYADVRRSRRLDPELRRLCRPDTRSALIIPIVGRSACIGVMWMRGPDPAVFTRQAVATAQILAAQFGAAVESVRLREAAQRHAGRLAFLNETARQFMACVSREDAERVMVREMARALRARRVIYLYHHDPRKVLKFRVGQRVSRSRLARLPWVRLSEAPLLALAVRERQAVACEDAMRQRALPPAVCRLLGLGAVIAVPIVEGRRLWGFLLADNGKQPIGLSPDDADMALALANQAAMAQGNTFRLNDAQRWSERLAMSMRETHHRIRNNLQAICDVLELELLERGGDAWGALEHSLQRVRAIATVHESLVYHQDAELVDVDQVLQRLVPLVVTATQRPGQAVQAKVEAQPLTQSSKRTTALALIVNELVGNAMRHGLNHDKRSMVKVSLTKRNGTICLRVADNGSGLPQDFELQRHGHLGLEIARTLAERELGGRLVLQRRRGRAGGTVASVRFSE